MKTVHQIRDRRKARAGARRYVRMANGARVSAAMYWRLFWYFDVGPAWKTGRKDRPR